MARGPRSRALRRPHRRRATGLWRRAISAMPLELAFAQHHTAWIVGCGPEDRTRARADRGAQCIHIRPQTRSARHADQSCSARPRASPDRSGYIGSNVTTSSPGPARHSDIAKSAFCAPAKQTTLARIDALARALRVGAARWPPAAQAGPGRRRNGCPRQRSCATARSTTLGGVSRSGSPTLSTITSSPRSRAATLRNA